MKGLILKDLIMTWKYCKAFLLLIVMFLTVSAFSNDTMFYILYPSIMASMIPMTLQAYDERSKWELNALTMPYSRAQLVSVKFVIGLFAGVLVVIATAILQALRMFLTDSFQWDSWLSIVTLVFALSCIAPALSLPCIFKLGSEKGRIYHSVITGVICGGSVLLTFGFPELTTQALSASSPLPILCLVAIAIYGLSWWLSIRFYEKREF